MIDVFLRQVPDYSRAVEVVPDLLASILPDISGSRILLKPNFVALRNAALSCTHPQIIFAAARYCREHGATVLVGDSPAFGTAQAIADATGLTGLLRPLDIHVMTLRRAVRIKSSGVAVPVSADALEADLILNLPKFKAHSQMRFSGAVKNLFGCIPGPHKAWLHALHGDKGTTFSEMICGLLDILPPVFNLLDGVVAMHHTGPIAGEQFPLNLLGASRNAVALDTAACQVLGREVDMFPIWAQCLRAGLPGSRHEELSYPILRPEDIDGKNFILPEVLKPESFRPDVLLRSLVKRIWLGRFTS